MNYSVEIPSAEVAALLLEMTTKTAVAGPSAAFLAYLHEQSKKAVASFSTEKPGG